MQKPHMPNAPSHWRTRAHTWHERRVQKHIATMRHILAQHANSGVAERGPSLQAVTTIYLGLLRASQRNQQYHGQPLHDSIWALFSQVAALPLSYQAFIPRCMTHGYYNPRLGVWLDEPCNNAPKCGHRNMPVTKTLRLTPVDDYMLRRGARLDSQQQATYEQEVQQWWASQLRTALGAS